MVIAENITKRFMGFKILSLDIIDHYILGSNTFKFVDTKDNPESIYFSVLIGPNGTGKSHVLKEILHLLRNFYFITQNEKPKPINYFFKLKFLNNDIEYTFTNFWESVEKSEPKTNLSIYDYIYRLLDGNTGEEYEIRNSKDILPKSIVASSVLLTDKFIVPVASKDKKIAESFPMYKYLGVKNRPQQASTNAYIKRVVDFIVAQNDSWFFKEGLNKITEYLELDNSIDIVYNTINTISFWHKDVTPNVFHNYFESIEKQYENKETIPPFKLNYYKSLIKNDKSIFDRICNFISYKEEQGQLQKTRTSIKKIAYDIIDKDSHVSLKDDYEYLNHLLKLGFLRSPGVFLKKKGAIKLEETSSGEFHLFSSLIGFMATMESNSLLLIDEPEISLHPNWQMKYIDVLSKIFSGDLFKTSQIIIATHSHFLISDLPGEESNIIGLKKENGVIKSLEINRDTYGWSAEQVLLDIFNVQTTRNYVVAERIGILLDLIAKEGSTRKEIKSKFLELEMDKFSSLPDEDPLKYAYDTILKEFINDKP